MSTEERAYLEKLENSLKNQIDYESPEEVEAEIRRRENARIARDFKPRNQLYTPGRQQHVSRPEDETVQRKSYQQDPRYREYYERLRQNRGGSDNPTAPYDDDVEAVSMDDLERSGYEAQLRSRPGAQAPAPQRPATRPGVSPTRESTQGTSRAVATPSAPVVKDFVPGSIVRLDDGSVAIYKDAVSGKDYALLYFLEPDTTIAPRGIFLEQYDAQRIGHMPEPLFAEMRDTGRWDRDAVIFHLEKYEYAGFVRHVAAHQEGRTPRAGARHATPLRNRELPPEETQQPEPEIEQRSEPKNMFERGRVIKINVGGKVWESVYWTKDEMGPIVAHNTHKEWSLMHLDLERFKDSMEFGDLLPGHKILEIERSIAKAVRA